MFTQKKYYIITLFLILSLIFTGGGILLAEEDIDLDEVEPENIEHIWRLGDLIDSDERVEDITVLHEFSNTWEDQEQELKETVSYEETWSYSGSFSAVRDIWGYMAAIGRTFSESYESTMTTTVPPRTSTKLMEETKKGNFHYEAVEWVYVMGQPAEPTGNTTTVTKYETWKHHYFTSPEPLD